MPYELWLYSAFYEVTAMVGSGLNSVTRAIDLAGFMGFDKIYVVGADSAIRIKRPRPDVPFGSPEHMRWLRDDTIMHADGGSALASEATPVKLVGEIDGGLCPLVVPIADKLTDLCWPGEYGNVICADGQCVEQQDRRKDHGREIRASQRCHFCPDFLTCMDQ